MSLPKTWSTIYTKEISEKKSLPKNMKKKTISHKNLWRETSTIFWTENSRKQISTKTSNTKYLKNNVCQKNPKTNLYEKTPEEKSLQRMKKNLHQQQRRNHNKQHGKNQSRWNLMKKRVFTRFHQFLCLPYPSLFHIQTICIDFMQRLDFSVWICICFFHEVPWNITADMKEITSRWG